MRPAGGQSTIIWKLITNLPVASHADAVHKLEWYVLRCKIEAFFRTLKTECRIEELRLATADRLANCIALCCVVAWRVSWLTMLSRAAVTNRQTFLSGIGTGQGPRPHAFCWCRMGRVRHVGDMLAA